MEQGEQQEFLNNFQNQQRTEFEQFWDEKLEKIFPSKKDLRDKILKLKNHSDFQDVHYAFGKLDKALQICDFLHELSKQRPSQDTEAIRITTLVSLAEAIYRLNKPEKIIIENLIKGFFKPVKSKIDYKIKGYVGSMPYEKIFDAVEVLYLVRNDYIHNGNFTGHFFKNPIILGSDRNIGLFYYSEKEDKSKLIEVTSDFSLTYEEFLDIFKEAFASNIEEYCDKKYKGYDEETSKIIL